MKISDVVLGKIDEALGKEKNDKFVWKGSTYGVIQKLPIDIRGELGESIAALILRKHGCDVTGDDNITDAERGYDLLSDGIKLEVKLATITTGSGGFQHENLHSQRDFDGILFIDIAPEEIFLTAAKKNDIIWKIKTSDNKNADGKKPKTKLTRRENGIYKCDFTIKHIQANDIPKFRDFRTGEVKTTDDFYKIYQHLVSNT